MRGPGEEDGKLLHPAIQCCRGRGETQHGPGEEKEVLELVVVPCKRCYGCSGQKVPICEVKKTIWFLSLYY
jgi:predicted hydrocarbon binding protein